MIIAEHARVATPTATETMLPWKREEMEGSGCGALKQSEFPAWASNKEYLAYSSPSATFLGKFILLVLDFNTLFYCNCCKSPNIK